MEYVQKNPKIYLICGKARSGKNTVAEIIYNSTNNAVTLSMTKYLKDYVKMITDWNGNDITKPRTLLQSIGIDLIKNKIDKNLLIHRTIEDIKVLSYFKDNIVISGIRLKDEIKSIKELFSNVITIKVESDTNNNLTKLEQKHITETDLDDYNEFDYIIENTGDYHKLSEQVESVVGEHE